jgi:photosystem II stability/assembly factor-like uncharacterized protein
MRLRRLSIAALAMTTIAGLTGFSSGPHPSWQLTDTSTTARFRGLSPVSASAAWVAGTAGTVLRTVDGGRHWASVGPADASALEFRDIEAFDARHAVALTIGEGTDSRIYSTSDGGRSWTQTFQNDDPAAFYDCMTFLDPRRGLALSDPVDGKFRILATSDGGRHWAVRSNQGMPAALTGEFAFAASGTCLVSTQGRAYFASGGGATSRIFSSSDLGHSWKVVDSPLPSGPSAGIYSLAFADPSHAIAVGGDYVTPTAAPDGSAYLTGHRWKVSSTVPGEYRSGAAWAGHGPAALAVGPTGSDLSLDGGRTWKSFDTGSFDAVMCTHDGACWASGEQGRVAKLKWGH